MTTKEKTSTTDHELQLKRLLDAVAARDRSAVARLLARSPALAHQAVSAGATRAEPDAYFFESIQHYAYAGDTPLHLAASAHAADIAADLLSLGVDVRAKNRRGAEPLHYAVDGVPGSPAWNPEAQSSVVRLLLGAGPDPDAVDKSGVGPLHRAVRTRCAAAVEALLAGGASPRRKNKSGSTPLHLAVQNTGRGGAGDAAARAEQARIIELLLRHGARPQDKNSAGKSVRECATADWLRALLGTAPATRSAG